MFLGGLDFPGNDVAEAGRPAVRTGETGGSLRQGWGRGLRLSDGLRWAAIAAGRVGQVGQVTGGDHFDATGLSVDLPSGLCGTRRPAGRADHKRGRILPVGRRGRIVHEPTPSRLGGGCSVGHSRKHEGHDHRQAPSCG